jgi:hypothetical protein
LKGTLSSSQGERASLLKEELLSKMEKAIIERNKKDVPFPPLSVNSG